MSGRGSVSWISLFKRVKDRRTTSRSPRLCRCLTRRFPRSIVDLLGFVCYNLFGEKRIIIRHRILCCLLSVCHRKVEAWPVTLVTKNGETPVKAVEYTAKGGSL